MTDNTPEECKAMIRAVQGLKEIPPALEKNFTSLKDYLEDFDFGENEITTYFRNYKRGKLFNVADEDFNKTCKPLRLKDPAINFQVVKRFWKKLTGVQNCIGSTRSAQNF